MTQQYRDCPESERALLRVVRYADLIDALRDGLGRKREIADRLDVSPETVYRRTRDLRDADLLERTPSGYELTNLGRLYADRYDSLCDFSDRIYEAQPLLDYFDDDLPPWKAFLDADVVTADQQDPHRPARRFEDRFRDVERFDGVFPVFTQRLFASLAAGLTADGDASRIALDDSVVDYYRSRDDDQFAEVRDHERLAFRAVDDPLPYGVVVDRSDEERGIILTVYGEQGTLRGLVMTDSSAAVAWATETFDRFWSDTESISAVGEGDEQPTG